MRRRAGSSWIIVGLIALTSPSVFADPTVTIFASTIELGKLVPTAAAAETQANLSVRLIADRFWQLSIVRDPDPYEDISMSVDGAVWTVLHPGLPVNFATGQPTPPEGVVVMARLRVSPTFDMRPGRRQYNLGLTLNGQRIETPVRFAFEIAPTVSFEQDPGFFAVNADRPSERRDYDFEPRKYLVRSNVPWALEVAPQDLQEVAADSYTVKALDVDGVYKPLNRAITIATGQPTGNSGTSVAVRLRLELAPVAIAGTYSTKIDVNAKTLASP